MAEFFSFADFSGIPPVTHLVIAAGGRGAGLGSLCGDVPKVLPRVGGKFVLAHQLELAPPPVSAT